MNNVLFIKNTMINKLLVKNKKIYSVVSSSNKI